MTDKKSENKGLSVLESNEGLAKMYQENAHLGSENLGGVSPLLKVHTQGRSTSNQLKEGSEPNDGWFFYKPTGEQFKEIECHILTISPGFRADGINKKNVFNQIMAGVIVNDKKPRPFVMYLTGLKLSPMWNFGKEISKYVHAKPVGVPMFALKVKLTTEKVKTDYGMSWTIKFELIKENELPVLVTNDKVFSYLKVQYSNMTDIITAIVDAKATEEKEEALQSLPVEPGVEEPDKESDNKEVINPEDIPF
jgi:hypothetical protein